MKVPSQPGTERVQDSLGNLLRAVFNRQGVEEERDEIVSQREKDRERVDLREKEERHLRKRKERKGREREERKGKRKTIALGFLKQDQLSLMPQGVLLHCDDIACLPDSCEVKQRLLELTLMTICRHCYHQLVSLLVEPFILSSVISFVYSPLDVSLVQRRFLRLQS